MELTRRAINNLNKNGFIVGDQSKKCPERPISEINQFNAELAALLHDVGHCPFSHLGEEEFDKKDVWDEFVETVKTILPDSLLGTEIEESKKPIGAVHEQLSCIIILTKYYEQLSNLKKAAQGCGEEDTIDLSVDFEFIIRCIIGLEYKEPDEALAQKNLLIQLINSSIFDMDKLDYIIRDSIYTGISTPVIDTQRLFRNMYVTQQYTLLFTSKAVPVLQNMIEARNNLYMYVYNHHTAVITDFLGSYIQRRMAHAVRDCLYMMCDHKSIDKKTLDLVQEMLHITTLGLVPKSYLFSIDAVVEQHRSDSDWLSLLNIISYASKANYSDENMIAEYLKGEIDEIKKSTALIEWKNLTNDELLSLAKTIQRIHQIINRYQERSFLKPWWKTIFEFSNFINKNFPDDNIRKQLGKLVCDNGNVGAELRSQIAKHVLFIANNNSFFSQEFDKLQDGDFFVVQRSVRFLDLSKIEKLDIALKSNEIIGTPTEADKQLNEYYIKKLTNVIPQKDFYSVYDKYSFYIYSKPLNQDKYSANANKCRKYYKKLEEIFVFVATELLRNGEKAFEDNFVNNNNEEISKENMLAKYEKTTII